MSKTDLTIVSDTDWARLAAYVDGEGCIGILHLKSGQWTMRLGVTSTDPRLPAWLLATFGGKCGRYDATKKNRRHRCRFDWFVKSHVAADLLRNCRPYLLLKADQADIALAFQATVRSARGGAPLSVTVHDHRAQLKAKLHVLNKKGPSDVAVASGG